jgi:hypothetical protein
MTFLVNPPKPAAVRVDEQGAPTHLDAHPLVGELRPVQRWLADVDWWSRPVSREYWKVLLRGQLLCEIYRDLLADDSSFIERVYD